MNTINGYGSNVNRLTGLATGMDTDAMVKGMTMSYQVRIDKMNQDRQIFQWKQEFYREIVKDIKGLQDYFDPLSDKYMMSEGKFNPMKVTNSNEGSLGVSADSTAQAGTYKINITKLATPAVIEGSKLVASNGSDVGLNTNISDLNPSVSGNIDFTINDEKITVASNGTVKDMIKSINDEINKNSQLKGKVQASFDELSKTVVFSNTQTGDASIKVQGSVLGFTGTVSKSGENAEFNLTYPDGRTVPVSGQKTNKFTANGIVYDLKAAGGGDITFKIEKNNTDEVVKNIKTFIQDYNKIVGKIENKLSEKKQFTYKPLTDAQKKDMKEDDIKKWEEKAKQGILKNDDYLEQLMNDLRGSFFDKVYDSKSSNDENELCMGIYGDKGIGLDTSKDFKERGQLFIKDEEKLKSAIENNIEELTKFFIGKSSLKSDPDKYVGTDSYYEDGLFTRMDRIIRQYAGEPGIGKDGMSTVKGVLNIFANKQYDFSITGTGGKNTMPDKIYSKTLSIEILEKKMVEAQNKYYAKFARLETAMNKLNSQMSSMYSQFGMSGQ